MGFKKDFLWGGAIAANQAEGGYDADGRGMTSYDFMTGGGATSHRCFTYLDAQGKKHAEPRNFEGFQLPKGASYAVFDDYYYPNHVSIDFYHRYKEDIALLAEMGFKIFRLSISWSRLFPKGNEKEPLQAGIDFYKSVFQECHKYGIEPLVTIHHFDEPLYFETNLGGWQSRDAILYFTHFAKTCFKEFKGLVHYWLTFNEINGLSRFSVKIGTDERIQKNFQELHYKLVASALAVKIGHEIDPDNKIGCMHMGTVSYPYTCHPDDVLYNRHITEISLFLASDVQCLGQYPYFTHKFLKDHHVTLDITNEDLAVLKEGTVDMYTFSYYSSRVETVQKDAPIVNEFEKDVRNPYISYSDWGWSLDPKGLRYYLNLMYDRYHLPIMIVENGLGAYDQLEEGNVVHDSYRIDYLRSHIEQMKLAIEDGVDLIGYTTWGCIDLVSGGTGEMAKRYGFIYVDKNNDGSGTLNRFRKDSFYWYKKVIASNGEELD